MELGSLKENVPIRRRAAECPTNGITVCQDAECAAEAYNGAHCEDVSVALPSEGTVALPRIWRSTPWTTEANGHDAPASSSGATNVLGTGCNSGYRRWS